MTKLHKQLATATATGALLLQSVLPIMASVDGGQYAFEVSGNGVDSESTIDFDREDVREVFQTNETEIVNDISVHSNTGENDANRNTGGDVKVTTGDTDISATIVNQANSNVAEVEACDCDGDTAVKVSGNGDNSDNDVEIDTTHATTLVQDNVASIVNSLDLRGVTGKNDADRNTGGSVEIDTGDVLIAPVEIANIAGVNTARIGGSGEGREMMVKVAGNGVDSDNDVEINSDRETGLFQTNEAAILNDVYFAGISGKNSASRNTGDVYADPSITTGDVVIAAGIYNEAGFNAAEVDCGCILNLHGGILENGDSSENEVALDLNDEMEVAQDNVDALLNTGDVLSDTGMNDADRNTSGMVEIDTGDTETQIVTSNLGGMNMFGSIEFDSPFGSFTLGL